MARPSRPPGRRPKRGGASNRGASGRTPAPKPAARSSRQPPPKAAPAPHRPARDRGLGGEQVEGRQAVRELLVAGRRKVREVLVAKDLERADVIADIVELADEQRVPVREVTRARLEAEARTEAPQGVLARAAPLPESNLDDLARRRKGQPLPFLVAVDGVTDPGNLGALLRSAECTGVTGIVLPRHRAVHVTPAVTKAAAGAVEHLPMTVVPGLPTALARLKELGVWVVGLDAGGEPVEQLTVADEPVVLVLGAEGAGLSRLVRQRCDAVVGLRLRGRLASLNVAAAAAIACYEVAARRTAD